MQTRHDNRGGRDGQYNRRLTRELLLPSTGQMNQARIQDFQSIAQNSDLGGGNPKATFRTLLCCLGRPDAAHETSSAAQAMFTQGTQMECKSCHCLRAV